MRVSKNKISVLTADSDREIAMSVKKIVDGQLSKHKKIASGLSIINITNTDFNPKIVDFRKDIAELNPVGTVKFSFHNKVRKSLKTDDIDSYTDIKDFLKKICAAFKKQNISYEFVQSFGTRYYFEIQSVKLSYLPASEEKGGTHVLIDLQRESKNHIPESIIVFIFSKDIIGKDDSDEAEFNLTKGTGSVMPLDDLQVVFTESYKEALSHIKDPFVKKMVISFISTHKVEFIGHDSTLGQFIDKEGIRLNESLFSYQREYFDYTLVHEILHYATHRLSTELRQFLEKNVFKILEFPPKDPDLLQHWTETDMKAYANTWKKYYLNPNGRRLVNQNSNGEVATFINRLLKLDYDHGYALVYWNETVSVLFGMEALGNGIKDRRLIKLYDELKKLIQSKLKFV